VSTHHTASQTPSPTHAEAGQAATLVTEYFARAIDALADWKVALAANIATLRGQAPLTTASLDTIVEPAALRLFDTVALPIYGAGFIAALDSLADANSHLAWWQGPDRARLVLAAQSVNKEHIDYSELEWYRVPLATGEAHVAGPYVDYLCSDEYTITVASPVHIDGQFVGAVALDLLIDRVERDLTPRLSALGGDISIVNGVGRVLLSTSAARATGDTIRGDDLNGFERYACTGMALEVLIPRG
jgi:hypothetical protein